MHYFRSKKSKKVHVQYPYASNITSLCRMLGGVSDRDDIFEVSFHEYGLNPCKVCTKLKPMLEEMEKKAVITYAKIH